MLTNYYWYMHFEMFTFINEHRKKNRQININNNGCNNSNRY